MTALTQQLRLRLNAQRPGADQSGRVTSKSSRFHPRRTITHRRWDLTELNDTFGTPGEFDILEHQQLTIEDEFNTNLPGGLLCVPVWLDPNENYHTLPVRKGMFPIRFWTSLISEDGVDHVEVTHVLRGVGRVVDDFRYTITDIAPRRTRRKTASTTRTTSVRTTGADEASAPPSAIQESQQQTPPPTNVAGQESRTWTNAFRRLFGVTATPGIQAVETPVHQRRVTFQSTSSDLNDHYGSEHDVSHTSEPEEVQEQSADHHHSVRLSGLPTRAEDADQQQDSEQPESNQEVLEQVPDDQRSSSRDQHSSALSSRSRNWDSWIPDYPPTSPVPSSARSPVRPATSPRPQSNRSDRVRSPNYTPDSPRPPSRRSDRTATPPTGHAHHAISPRFSLAPPEPDSIHIRWDIRCMEELFGRPQMIIQIPIGITFEYGPDVRNGLWCAPMWLDPSTDMDDERQEGILRRLGSWPRRVWVTRRTYRGWWHVEMTHVLGG
ncbi:DNA-directed RNA polymerase II subunit rpb1 [Elsinoe australis]|uniref:DNA-directed RNA polymerase II subunit rpb1 n=1 Tax=Elsinoe australis TaxID=40998 RepID=A0A2P7Z4B9_9PEZI|nr:DNA-directed RNA polymerase II subunit rpb1 [Elsinoe australis]